jgi:hypothetical protein
MVEVQAHGFGFEKWVRSRFFSDYEGNYMQKWDVFQTRLNHLPEHLTKKTKPDRIAGSFSSATFI